MSNNRVREVVCPKCLAGAGYPCEGKRGYRKSNHAARIRAYRLENPRPKFTFQQLREMRSGKVYFIYDGAGSVKIGFTTKSPKTRLRSLQTGNPLKLTLLASFPGDAQDEKNLHARFSDKRKSGEWFECDDEIAQFIADIPL